MNNHMYEHAATQANIELLRARGVHIVEPEVGRLASLGEQGIGRLAEPHGCSTCAKSFSEAMPPRAPHVGAKRGACRAPTSSSRAPGPGDRGEWSGLRVLVSAGGTREPIDSVRFIGNSSSGRMGFALAADRAHARRER